VAVPASRNSTTVVSNNAQRREMAMPRRTATAIVFVRTRARREHTDVIHQQGPNGRPWNGAQVWKHKLIGNKLEGIDMAPQLYDGKVLISTIPGSSSNFYQGGAFGTVYSLNAKTGKTTWSFQTIKGGAKLFGNPKVNSGGGLWYPPSVDAHGRVFLSVANPAPLYGTPKFPNGSSRPGANLYTDSIVALDGQTGKLLWFRQAIRHDLRDYDLMIPAITATVPVQGIQTEVELVAGKMGKAYAYRADNGQHLWTRPVGKH
jgi:outer membrane protein assembly factor BamB